MATNQRSSPPRTPERLGRASGRAPTEATIYADVMAAMQQAEDEKGPKRGAYIALMERIAEEAQRRARAARHSQRVEARLLLDTLGPLLRECSAILEERGSTADLAKRIRAVQAQIVRGVG
jgi:predicted RNA-binding protein YlxR (DUF448 family)